MAENVTQKLIRAHLVDGEMTPGAQVALKIDQTLTQDATGTLVMLQLEAMDLDRVRTDVSAQYVDHNLIQADFRNPDDHLFLKSACERFGLWYSRPGNGVSHPVHMQRFGKPGKSLLGSDSHTCAAGSLGMLAMGAGGMDVAMAMAGEPFHLSMPEVWGIRLTGELPDWVSAKDVILEVLRRHGTSGAKGCILEYYGPGLESLEAMDRHVIANMGQETGATTSVFPSDGEVRRFLAGEDREEDWIEMIADEGCDYDRHDEIDLSTLEPLIAKPSSPGNVVPVREVAGEEIYQAYIGSSANPGYRDFAVPALMVADHPVAPGVSFDVNPTSRQQLEALIRDGYLTHLIHAGARLHQAGCNGCIGMGQAPATGRNSLRTVPRNFPARSGTVDDRVFLCSPETATASAIRGCITDPRDLGRDLGIEYPRVRTPDHDVINKETIVGPLPSDEAREVELVKGPNVSTLPEFDPLPDHLRVPVLLKLGDDISTDEILPAGTRVLPYRSNIAKISEFAFGVVDDSYVERAERAREQNGGQGHAVVGGSNYGQGSSREHAALAPRYLGLRVVLARDIARIHRQNLVNYGVLPLTFEDGDGFDRVEQGDTLVIEDVHGQVRGGRTVTARIENGKNGGELTLRHDLSDREVDVLLTGGLVNWWREQRA